MSLDDPNANLTPDEAFLAKNKDKDGVITLASGFQYKVLVEGSGLKHPMKETPCDCHYMGTLIDGTEFDSSFKRGRPSTFAPAQVIKGWTQAMQMMVEGDKWEMYIPYHLAYGANGKPPKIPPKATLIFIMELVKIKGPSQPMVCFPDWTEEELALWTAKDEAACASWRDSKVAKYEAGDAKLKEKYATREALDEFVEKQCETTKNQALWKRTKKAKQDAKNGKWKSSAVDDDDATTVSASPPPAPATTKAGEVAKKVNATTARAILDAALATFQEPANKAQLVKVVEEIEAMPVDASSKQMQKMMKLLPLVQKLMGPALAAHGFQENELMSVAMQMQTCAADDPSIGRDTLKLMKAAQGDLSDFM